MGVLDLCQCICHHRCEAVLTIGHRREKCVFAIRFGVNRQAVTTAKIMDFVVCSIYVGFFFEGESLWETHNSSGTRCCLYGTPMA